METNKQPLMVLRPGQCAVLDAPASARLILTQGEVHLQPRAQWIGETIVFAPPRTVSAPATVDCGEFETIVALADTRLQIERSASLLGSLRGWLSRPSSVGSRPPRLSRA